MDKTHRQSSLEYWNTIYRQKHGGRADICTDGWLEVFDDIILNTSMPVLDLGCGSGNDTLYLLNNGEQVAVGTVMALMMAEELRKACPDFQTARDRIERFFVDVWEDRIRKAYGAAGDEIIAIERKAGKNRKDRVLSRIGSMEKQLDCDFRADGYASTGGRTCLFADTHRMPLQTRRHRIRKRCIPRYGAVLQGSPCPVHDPSDDMGSRTERGYGGATDIQGLLNFAAAAVHAAAIGR